MIKAFAFDLGGVLFSEGKAAALFNPVPCALGFCPTFLTPQFLSLPLPGTI